jgi:hypothetical protein
MNLTFQDLQKKPDFDATSPVNRNRQHRLYDYYGRPVSPPPPFTTENRPDAPQH